jgi:ubiquinone/menaquinone biosynthesis C-methylase UbiE
MGIRNDWWHEEFAKGNPAPQMGGGDGREGVPHPTHTWLTEYVPRNSKLLDVGCCNAHTLESFRRAGKQIQYWGVDHLQELVDYCEQTYPTASFSQSDAADLQDFEDNSFDYVLSRHVWEHLNHYSQHLMEMYRVTKSEVIIVGFLEFTGNDFDRLQWGVKENGKLLPHWYNQYSKEGVERFIRYNMPGATYEFIDDFKDIGHPVLIIRKAHND